MKKGLLVLVTFLAFFSNVQAKDISLSLCEYSQEYISWLNLSESERANTSIPYMCANHEEDNSGFKPTVNMSIYSLRDKYTLEVRDQKGSRSCWAFATLASIESNMLLRKIASEHLSAGHLELKTQNSLYMPGYVNFDRDFNSGGSIELTNAYVLNNWGPILEKDLSFTTITDIIENGSYFDESIMDNKKAIIDVDDIYMLRNDSGVCSDDSIGRIKEYLINNGAMAANIYFEMATNKYEIVDSIDNLYTFKDKFLNGMYYYYNGEAYTDSYNRYVPENQIINHQVTIVGWDDNVPKESFSTMPSRDGAFIVMNSYGKTREIFPGKTFNMGDSGFYYVSYDDINICTSLVGYYNVTNKVSEYAYYYDDLGANSTVTNSGDEVYLANIFEKKSAKTEILDKVTIAVDGPGYKYTIYYANNDKLNNYKEIGSGVSEHQGYISKRFDKEIYLTKDFSIVVKLEKEGASSITVPIAIEALGSTIYNNYDVTDGVSYISSDGETWAPFKTDTYGIQNSIRVYTTSTDIEINGDEEEELELNDKATVDISNPNDTYKSINSGDDLPDNPQTGLFDLALVAGAFILIVIVIKKTVFTKFYKI